MKPLANSGRFRFVKSLLLLVGIVLFIPNRDSGANVAGQTPDEEETQRLLGTLREEGIEKRDPDTLAGAIERLFSM